MAASANSSKIFVPFMPSLWHRAVTKFALQLYNKFDFETLEMAAITMDEGFYPFPFNGFSFTEPPLEYPTQFKSIDETTRNLLENRRMNIDRAIEVFDPLPPNLRRKVMETITHLERTAQQWHEEHERNGESTLALSLHSRTDCVLYWRDDGTIDATKTAQELIKDQTIHIEKRFEIACMYCFEESIQSLWREMLLTGLTENYDERIEMTNNCMTRFWVRWMREGCRVPWIQAAVEYLDPPPDHSWLQSIPIPRFSSFFNLLRPEDRQKFLRSLKYAYLDDLRSCLYAMTRDEEEQMMRIGSGKLVKLYLKWPLQSFFLETVGNLYDYMDDGQFYESLSAIHQDKPYRYDDLDYGELLDCFWVRSPGRFTENFNSFLIYKHQKQHCIKIQDLYNILIYKKAMNISETSFHK